MKTIKFYIRIYLICVLQDMKTKMGYRADFVIGIVGTLVTNIVSIATLSILFSNIYEIHGWTYEEMLFVYAFYCLVSAPFQLAFDHLWSLEQHLLSGSFIKYYFRPIHIFFYYISESFNIKAFGQLVIGIGLFVYSCGKLQVDVDLVFVLQLLVQYIGAVLAYAGIMIVGSALSFWAINYNSILSTIMRLSEYATYPFSIFNMGIRILFTFVIPLAFIAYYPAVNLLKPWEGNLVTILSPVVGIFLFITAIKVWMRGARNFAGTGS